MLTILDIIFLAVIFLIGGLFSFPLGFLLGRVTGKEKNRG